MHAGASLCMCAGRLCTRVSSCTYAQACAGVRKRVLACAGVCRHRPSRPCPQLPPLHQKLHLKL